MGGRTELVLVDGFLNAEDYRDNLLAVVLPYAQEIGENLLLMHDNARPHTAKMVRLFFEIKKIDVQLWAAQSPDLNPIEHVWDTIGREMLEQNVIFKTGNQLCEYLREQSHVIVQKEIDNLILQYAEPAPEEPFAQVTGVSTDCGQWNSPQI